MDGALSSVRQLKAPEQFFGDLDAEAAATLITAAADIVLVIDDEGIIRDLAFDSAELAQAGVAGWLDRPWLDTVTVESRPKIEALIAGARANEVHRWRQVNHPSSLGPDIPISYSAFRVGKGERIVVVGRDMRAISRLQQRLLDVQQSLERDYARLRHAEARYRLLFQVASEAVFIVDADSREVIEANPAAGRLLDKPANQLLGRTFPAGFESRDMQAIETLLRSVRATGRSDEITALGPDEREFLVGAALFRQDDTLFLLLRIVPQPKTDALPGFTEVSSHLLDIVASSPDGFVVTDAEGRILTTNRAFLELAELATEEQARGESLDRWLGRRGVDFDILTTNLREHGAVRLFSSVINGELGATAAVELSAVALRETTTPIYGFTLRNVDRRPGTGAPHAASPLPQSAEQLTELIGQVSLKELVRETTDVIERLCIEAALELTGDNRASAAEMLGLSRQSLYVKLRRYGLGDINSQ